MTILTAKKFRYIIIKLFQLTWNRNYKQQKNKITEITFLFFLLISKKYKGITWKKNPNTVHITKIMKFINDEKCKVENILDRILFIRNFYLSIISDFLLY